jgi:hypothetical protein
MSVQREASSTSLIDVLDRVLDKGIVIDAWIRVSLVGIDLVTVEARVVVASIDTYLKYSEMVGHGPQARSRSSESIDRRSFRSGASSRSALPANDDDDDDDDDEGPGGSGSSGAPAFDTYPLKPRRRPPLPRVTRRRNKL